MDGGRIRRLLTDAKSHADVGDMLLASQLYTKATEIEPNNALHGMDSELYRLPGDSQKNQG